MALVENFVELLGEGEENGATVCDKMGVAAGWGDIDGADETLSLILGVEATVDLRS
ncbi:MAG: hypothetical protein QOF17_1214 [Solirubrobacteraceae bacterium]|jgi:hypothetical protein|nr:hypothetical protein [Solirubrobacteraceae bacterium]